MKYLLFICFTLIIKAPVNAQIDNLFRPWNHDTTPGLAVAIQYRGATLHQKGYGMANLEHHIPITPTSVFDLASVSKQFCAFAIALLIDQGKLNLDDDIRTFLLELPDFGHVITIQHLLFHTSGIRDWPGMLGLSGRDMQDVISMKEIHSFVTHQQTLNFNSGTKYSYSNTGYNLLAMIIEQISGQSFRSFMDDTIFSPLHMTQTHFQDDHEEIVVGRVTSYGSYYGEFRRIGNGLMALGSSSLHSTTEDLIKWVDNFENPVVGSAAVHSMMNSHGYLNDGTPIPYGFGLIHGTYRGLKTVSHSGSWAGFRTIILRVPAHEFTVILLGNHSIMNATQLAQRIVEYYLGAFLDPDPSALSSPQVTYSPEDYEGVYDFHNGLVIQLNADNTSLTAKIPPLSSVPVQFITVDSLMIPTLNLTIGFISDSTLQVTHGVMKDIKSQRLPLPDEEPPLPALEACYTSEELNVSYQVIIQNSQLMIGGPRGIHHSLKKLTDTLYHSDTWYMPVIRFFVNQDTNSVSHFETSSSRNQRVAFKQSC
ncbi:MAG: serine hydrolase [Bacteroidetes bacterium]|nr:serine hydrolase [Bacteroidota bacterium]